MKHWQKWRQVITSLKKKWKKGRLNGKEVIWPLQAQKQLARAYDYILQRSYQNAEKVKADILASTNKLSDHPEIHSPDKYRKNNHGSFRAYELHHYRIAYRVTEKEIIIVRIRHTSMELKKY